MEIEVRFDRVSVMAIQKKKVAGRSKSRKTNSAWRYHKKSMNELAETFGYSNADNTKNQKARC